MLKVWELNNGKLNCLCDASQSVYIIYLYKSSINSICKFDDTYRNNDHLVTGSSDHTLKIWEIIEK